MEQETIQNNTDIKNTVPHTKKNIYPIVRHSILVILTLLAAIIVIFLIYQNGKSIYDNGI